MESLAFIYQTKRRHISQDSNIDIFRRNYQQNIIKLMFGHSSVGTVFRLLDPTQTTHRLIVFLSKKLLSSAKHPDGHFRPHSLLFGDKMAYA
jgi:hypothetical protein